MLVITWGPLLHKPWLRPGGRGRSASCLLLLLLLLLGVGGLGLERSATCQGLGNCALRQGHVADCLLQGIANLRQCRASSALRLAGVDLGQDRGAAGLRREVVDLLQGRGAARQGLRHSKLLGHSAGRLGSSRGGLGLGLGAVGEQGLAQVADVAQHPMADGPCRRAAPRRQVCGRISGPFVLSAAATTAAGIALCRV